MKEVAKYSGCFVCGDQNEHGLQAKFYYDGRRATTKVTAREMFEGYKNIYHGGIISTLLDEVMIKAILAQDIFAVTAEMTVRYHAPVPTGAELIFTGEVANTKGRVYHTTGQAVGADGTVYASAEGKYVRAKEALKEKLMASLD
ncbi:PaaI family thioesterase [candidate division GN15 bacterium]|nr:PaaI family thioesterase [candidate division GN15 bacterium]